MDLAEFVDVVLRQIIEGVERAQSGTRNLSKHISEADVINPKLMYEADSAPRGKHYATQGRNLVHFVEFDVAVTTGADLTNGKISVLGFGAVGEGAESTKDTIASRIKFAVPITLPRSKDNT